MLVDNKITGDSRVQKSAREMAARGWNVTLVGRGDGLTVQHLAAGEEPAVGEAVVIRVPLPRAVAFMTRNSSWSPRHPMAYRSNVEMKRFAHSLQWRKLDVQARLGAGDNFVTRAPAQVSRKLLLATHRLRVRATRARDKDLRSPGLAFHTTRQWRYDEPFIADLEVAFAPIIEEIRPDLIHAHDFRSLPIAVRAANRLARTGARPAVIYDAHEFLPGVEMDNRRRHRGAILAEREHIRGVDAIITVSDPVADRLVSEHGLETRPLVIYNTPIRDGSAAGRGPDVRHDAGIADDVPLLVYVGAAAIRRGLMTVVDSLGWLPDVHFVCVSPESAYTRSLADRAGELGAGDRFHRVDYVDPDQVSSYVASATMGVSPLHHTVNHDLALPTKLFEYMHGRLPILTSDVTASAELVTRLGIGLVHAAEDARDFARTCTAMLSDIDLFRRPYADPRLLRAWSWEPQHDAVEALYERLTGGQGDPGAAERRTGEQSLEAVAEPSAASRRAAAEFALESLARAAPPDVPAALLEVEHALFDRSLHFDGASSPLADNPVSYLAGWRSNPVVRGIADGPRRDHDARAIDIASARCAIIGYRNLTWAPEVLDALTAIGMPAPTCIDLRDDDHVGQLSDHAMARMLAGHADSRVLSCMERIYSEHDLVWVEWAERAAVIASAVDPGRARVVVRLHAYEAFKPALHYVSWGRVDDLVFVGPHLRDMVSAVLAESPGYARVRQHVIPLWIDTDRFQEPKDATARFQVGVLKWASPAKDAAWAVEVLAELRRADPRYRLLLIGDDGRSDQSVGARQYVESVLAAIDRLGVGDSVEFSGHVTDVPRALRGVGVILSSSRREGAHTALLEGAASGAVPVVRDWPLMARWNGPRRLFPAEWVVGSVREAVDRIVATTKDEARWRAQMVPTQTAMRERFGRAAGASAMRELLARPGPPRTPGSAGAYDVSVEQA